MLFQYFPRLLGRILWSVVNSAFTSRCRQAARHVAGTWSYMWLTVSRWRSQKNGLPQGSVLATPLFNIYTNDQTLPTDCSRFIYADDLRITTQQSDFQHVEQTLELALDEMSIILYYSSNHLKPNPTKTQICCFHLRNRDTKRKLYVTWNGLELDHYPNPIYLGVTLEFQAARP